MSGKLDDTEPENVIRDDAVRSGRPLGSRGSRWRGAIIILGFVAAVAAVATTYCMRRVPLRETKPPAPVSSIGPISRSDEGLRDATPPVNPSAHRDLFLSAAPGAA